VFEWRVGANLKLLVVEGGLVVFRQPPGISAHAMKEVFRSVVYLSVA